MEMFNLKSENLNCGESATCSFHLVRRDQPGLPFNFKTSIIQMQICTLKSEL